MKRKALGLALSLGCLTLVACPRPNYRTPLSRNLKAGGKATGGGTDESKAADALVSSASGCLPLQSLVATLAAQSDDDFIVHTYNLELGLAGATEFVGTDQPTRLENLLRNSLLPNASATPNGLRPVLMESLVGKQLLASAQVGALLAVKNQDACTSVSFVRENGQLETFKVIQPVPTLPTKLNATDAKSKASLKLVQKNVGSADSGGNQLVLQSDSGETRTYTAKPGRLLIKVVAPLPKTVSSCSHQKIGFYKAEYVVNYRNPSDDIGLDSNFAVLLKKSLETPTKELSALAPSAGDIAPDLKTKAKMTSTATPRRTISLAAFVATSNNVHNGLFSGMTCETEKIK